MTHRRTALPQLGGQLFLTDGGLETTLIFHEGLELPDFAAYDLLGTPAGEEALRRYFRAYADVARRLGVGIVLESPTWRANADWGARLGYSVEALADANRRAIALVEDVRAEFETPQTAVVVSGCVGPRGDGYDPSVVMSADAARAYHEPQIATFAGTSADMVGALTMNYAAEAVGLAQAARTAGMPVAISFTVETDGRLATGQSLKDAIAQVDDETSRYPAYYMINCAHPTHFAHALADGGAWTERLKGLRANASRKSHAELNDSVVLDAGQPGELARAYAALRRRLPGVNVLGGCCGTDHRHVEEIGRACLPDRGRRE